MDLYSNQSSARLILIICMVFGFLLLSSCGGPTETPEAQVNHFIETGKNAAEARDAFALGDLVAENYQDRHGRSRKDVLRLLAAYLLRHKNIHLLTRTSSLTFPTTHQARLSLYVAMADLPLDNIEALAGMRADLYLFELELVKQNDTWLLVSGSWRRAQLDDFLT